jgi:hypothetical protein
MAESILKTGIEYASPAAPSARKPKLTPEQAKWRWFFGAIGLLLVLYLLLENPYWVPGGDSDFYVAIARNLAREGRYEYNGLPVAISPPGWPMMMAAVLKVSPYFLTLKLVTLLCMLGSLALSFFILLRFVNPRVAAGAIVLTGLLMPVYSLTYFLHSEGLYCLLSAWALLLAFRIREKPGRIVDICVLLLLCVAIPYVRWAGVFQVLPMAAVLLSGEWGKYRERRWIVAGLSILLVVSVWLATRWSLQLTAQQMVEVNNAGGGSVMDTDATGPSTEEGNVVGITNKNAKLSVFEDYGQRFLRSGKWFAWLLWHPMRFAAVQKWADSGVTVLGWLVIALLAYLVMVRTRRGELVWLALAVYCGALCMNWPNPNARYFVPVAPLIVVGILLSIRTLGEHVPATRINWAKWMRRAFVYSVLLCNLLMYGVDVIIMRSSRFYEDFEAGQHKDLVSIAYYLTHLGPMPSTAPAEGTTQPTTFPSSYQYHPRDGEIVINEKYENLGRVRWSKAGMRAMVLLTDRNIKPLDTSNSRTVVPPFSGKVNRELKNKHAKWLLVQTPAVPWRVWHFRLSRSLQEMLSRYPNQPDSGGWTLYFNDAGAYTLTPQPVPQIEDWPKRVPGM